MTKITRAILTVVITLGIPAVSANAQQQFPRGVEVDDAVDSPATEFALADLKRALGNSQLPPAAGERPRRLEITMVKDLNPQGYRIANGGPQTVVVSGGDAVGAMYGVLDIAEQISFGRRWEQLHTYQKSPFILQRGIKMNVPLDARLPSYDDTGDAAQKNIAEMWSLDFWQNYLDSLARNRYNVLTLWSKHPFPALIKLKEYPQAALPDVYAYTGPITADTHKDWGGIDLHNTQNLMLVKRMTIEEKIAFWQKVMQYAHDRGIQIILFTWNIYLPDASISPQSPEAIKYVRQCVAQLAKTYPHLGGIGVTAGERMGPTIGKFTNVQWLYETYGVGAASVLKDDPQRTFRFIFRRHHTNLEDIDKDFTSHYPGPVETSFKYSMAHMYSSTEPPLFDGLYGQTVEQYGYKCWMNLRNDDIFVFRWGDPDFARSYLTKMATYPLAGFYIGSDGYVWGRDFTSKTPSLAGVLEAQKHWYRELIWGRLAYDAQLDRKFFQSTLASHFPDTDAAKLYTAWQTVSKIFPLVNNFHWQPTDSMWAVEGCMGQAGFETVRDFIDCYTFEPDKILDIPAFATKYLNGEPCERTTPLQVADALLEHASSALEQVAQLRRKTPEAADELQATLYDLQCLAHYGDYYGHKISGAVYLRLYEAAAPARQKDFQIRAVRHLEQAAAAWKQLANLADRQYHTQLLARTRPLDWVATIADVEQDVTIANRSSGQIPKIAKLFNVKSLGSDSQFGETLTRQLEESGYNVTHVPWWELDGNATGLKLVFGQRGELVHEFFKGKRGKLPSDFDDIGHAIVPLEGNYWIIMKDRSAVPGAIKQLQNEISNGTVR